MCFVYRLIGKAKFRPVSGPRTTCRCSTGTARWLHNGRQRRCRVRGGERRGTRVEFGSMKCELLSGIYDRNFIDAAQRRFTDDDGVPRLTRRQVAALDALDATCDDPGVRLDMRLEPGDVQWLHNHTTFHARCAYSDGDGDTPSVRHLLRLWITPPDARPLPARFAERFGDLRVGPRRGGIRVEGQTPFCALEPGA